MKFRDENERSFWQSVLLESMNSCQGLAVKGHVANADAAIEAGRERQPEPPSPTCVCGSADLDRDSYFLSPIGPVHLCFACLRSVQSRITDRPASN